MITPMHSEGQPRTPGIVERLAWLPIPLLLGAIIAARMAGLSGVYKYDTLRLFLSFIFYTLVTLCTLYLIGRSFLASGSLGLLLLECGVIFWSLSGTIGDLVFIGDANINVTVFNIGILLAGLCHLAGSIFTLRAQQVLGARPVLLGLGFAFAVGALWLVSYAALRSWLPDFFIQGHGGTPVRYFVLISSILAFLLSAGLLKANKSMAHLPFTYWYVLALLMLAVGLFGVMIQLSLGGIVNWLSRAAQWLGGVYLFVAAFASLRVSKLPVFPLQKESYPPYYSYAVAALLVLAATSIRLAFLPTLGTKAVFVTFFPAVVIASIYGGLGSGLVATVLSGIVIDYFWIEPVGRFSIGEPSDWLSMSVFLVSGAMIAGISHSMLRARTRASMAETQALLSAERATAAEALQRSEEKYHSLFMNMTEEVHFWKLVRDENGQIKTWRVEDINPPTIKAWQRKSREDTIGKIADEIYPGATEHFMPIVQKIMKEGKPYSYVDYFPPPVDKYFRFTSIPLGEYFFTTGADITDIKKAQEIAEQKNVQLEEVNKEMESFSYSISHDLRAPLRAIDGYSRMLLRDLEDKIEGDAKRKLNTLRENVQKMAQLIDDLLRLSRLGRQDISLSTVNMEELVKDVWEENKALIADRNIYFKISDMISVDGDAALLKQVVSNLITNAIKFTRPREEATIEAGSREEEKEIVYYIKDNGVGFDMEYYNKLFGVFHRLHSDSEFEGTGIGLSIVQRIIHRHGGRVWANSKNDKGSTFYFSLPIFSPHKKGNLLN